MELKQLQDELAAIAAERGLGAQQNPKNLALAVAANTGALLALFQWLSDEQSWRLGAKSDKEVAAEAIADIVTHAVRLADELGIDLDATLQARIALKVPAGQAKRPGRAVSQPRRQPEPVPEAAPPAPPPAPIEAPAAAAPAAVHATVVEEILAAAPPPVEPEPAAAPAPPVSKEAERVRAPPTPEPPPTKEKKAEGDATPPWLDGLIPPRVHTRGRKAPPEATTAAAAPKAVDADPPPAAPARSAAPATVGALETTGEVVAPPREPPKPSEKERYTDLDPEATKTFVRSLAKRVDATRGDDPLVRELHDELETLRRALYSSNPKRSWLADSLITIRNLLEEAARHSVGDQLRAGEHIAQIERMLDA
jgi:NTP pyrophosphatase (non-canonical NTP hydrolase)